MKRLMGTVGWGALLLLLGASAQGADEYRIGADDILTITVWERPDLTRQVSVRAGGQITFPPIGDVVAAGETTASLARLLEQRLYDFLRRPTQVTVEVASFFSQRVTVAGAVTNPGRLSFERIPGLVEVLGAAGGLSPGGDLGRIQILRTEGDRQTAVTVDLAQAMARGDLSNLPALQAGDVVFVPSIGGETGGAGPAYVLGDVARPGAVPVGSGLDILKVLSLAGGTLPTAKLDKVQVIGSQPGGEPFVAEVDLERLFDTGNANFLVRPGDTIRVPPRRGPLSGAWGVTREFLGVSRDVLNLILISDVLQNNNSNN